MHESFLFNERFMQRSVYIFIKSKFFFFSKHAIVPILLVTIDFVTKNFTKVILVYLFILCTQPYNNYMK
jgi:hypothetical protein